MQRQKVGCPKSTKCTSMNREDGAPPKWEFVVKSRDRNKFHFLQETSPIVDLSCYPLLFPWLQPQQNATESLYVNIIATNYSSIRIRVRGHFV